MIGIILLFSVFLNGYILNRFLLKQYSWSLAIPLYFLLGSFISISAIYFLSVLMLSIWSALFIYFLVCAGIYATFFVRVRPFAKRIHITNKLELLIFLSFLMFSFFIMVKSLRYDAFTGEFLVASNIYLDFGAHIPFIRSFSLGSNIPAEVPFFAGKSLSYHLLYDFYIGLLEFTGLRIDVANNLVSTIGFASLLYGIYEFGVVLFKKKVVGLLGVVFFIFPSNLSFIPFLKTHWTNILQAIWHNSFYLSDSPFGKNIVSVFLNLNTYLNQRQMIFGLLFLLVLLIRLFNRKIRWERREILIWAIMLGLLSFWHFPSFLMGEILLLTLLVFDKSLRNNIVFVILLSGLIAMPYILELRQHSVNAILFKPGFLTYDNFTLTNFIAYWFSNLGITLFVAIIGFIDATRWQKKVFLLFLPLFLLPNFFQFSRDMFDNHKFFNMWIILLNIFSAYGVFLIWKNIFIGKVVATILFAIIIFSGVINFFVIKNDVYARIIDYPQNNFMRYAIRYIDNKKISLTNGEIYDPVSLVGKKTFIGRPHYIYAYGGDPTERMLIKVRVLSASNPAELKELLVANNISYAVVYKDSFAKNVYETNINGLKKGLRILYEDDSGIIFSL